MPNLAELPLDQAAKFLWDDQRKRWEAGEQTFVEEYLKDIPDDRRDALALELIYGEYLIRQEHGESPHVDEYVRRFPAIETEIRRQLAFDAALSSVGSTRAFHLHAEQTLPDGKEAGPQPGKIGSYTIVETLASGSQATAYRAIHPTLGRDVVIKLGHESFVDDATGRDRIVEEGRVLAELDHPNLARVYDCGFEDGRPFLVMEYIPGRTLNQYARQTNVAAREAANIVRQVAGALSAAHAQGISHLDIKPQNILIDASGKPRLIDFGLARIEHAWNETPTDDGTLAGTIAFMAPEQAACDTEKIGPASDLFGLGGVLYFLLTGKPVISGESAGELLDNARRCEWDREALSSSGAPSAIQEICERALAATPEERCSLEEFSQELQTTDKTRWTKSNVAILLASLLTASVFVVPGLLREPVPESEENQLGSTASTKSSRFAAPLEIRVFRNNQFSDLIDCVPITNSDELKLSVMVPGEVHAALFLLDSEGNLQKLSTLKANSTGGALVYPSAPVTGPPGTETVIAVGLRDRQVEPDLLERLLGEERPWPALPDGVVLGLIDGELETLQMSRALGKPSGEPDPVGDVRRHLLRIKVSLASEFDYYEVVSFAHK